MVDEFASKDRVQLGGPEFLGYVMGTSWHKEEYSLGSYSGAYTSGGERLKDAVKTFQHNGLIFAGEAWSTEYQGFMNGALVTGQRAANVLIIKNQCKEQEQ